MYNKEKETWIPDSPNFLFWFKSFCTSILFIDMQK